MYYYLSIGTNINPRLNAIKITKELCHNFGSTVIYPFNETTPENIKSNNCFLNSIAIIQSDLKELQIKRLLNDIECRLGRDRSDPNSSKKDRPADIDIIFRSEKLTLSKLIHHVRSVTYMNDVLYEKKFVDLSQEGLKISNGPSTIDIDSSTSEIFIINNKIDSL